ncbi:CDP-glucose 4,6-dehydratase [Silvimonas sp. JCM 19000]
MFNDIYRGRSVLVTGDTGFKGSWLALWLQQAGAQVHGYSLPAEPDHAHSHVLGLGHAQTLADIRDVEALRHAMATAAPEIVFHLAAQPLVLTSYQDPLSTWQINVQGTANVLEIARHLPSVRAVVVITTDKCYENREWPWGYREIDALGGHDPYSASKAAAELVAASYRASFAVRPGMPPLYIATARAGNVIGGGDWAQYRLIPDIARAAASGEAVEIRNPLAIRPWQHVLESLSAYLLIGQHLLQENSAVASAWNVGPSDDDIAAVQDVLTQMQSHWPQVQWRKIGAEAHETNALRLDSSRLRQGLGWKPVWTLAQTLAHTAQWYQAWQQGQVLSALQLQTYLDDARAAGIEWAQ